MVTISKPITYGLFLGACLALAAQADRFVYEDKNGNGMPDDNEPGIAGALVSAFRKILRPDSSP
jgi:hypothetical protein